MTYAERARVAYHEIYNRGRDQFILGDNQDLIERVVSIAVEAAAMEEREACAQIAAGWVNLGLTCEVSWDDSLYPDTEKIAAAIRART